jgi:hypothetical protein
MAKDSPKRNIEWSNLQALISSKLDRSMERKGFLGALGKGWQVDKGFPNYELKPELGSMAVPPSKSGTVETITTCNGHIWKAIPVCNCWCSPYLMAAKKTKQEEALQFLDDLDSFAPPSQAAAAAPSTAQTGGEGEAAEVLAFLDEITQKSTEPTRPTTVHISRSSTPLSRKSIERVRLGGGSSFNPSASSSTTSLNRTLGTDAGRGKERVTDQSTAGQAQNSDGRWGWGSVWSTASAAIQQAKTVVDEQVKHLPKNEQARKWGEGVLEYAKTAQLDKIGALLHPTCCHLF